MENQRKPKPMTHFYHSKNLFLDKTEESMVLNGRETDISDLIMTMMKRFCLI